MALSKASNIYNRPSWEDADFPILCQVCLGDNPYLRMMKEPYGNECKICKRPFTIFRWCPGRGMRYKKTEICQTCCKLKNVCQTCLLDLEYGLPVQVRDQALQVQDTVPKNIVNRDYYMQNVDRQLAQTDGTVPAGELANVVGRSSDMLQKLSRKTPYYRRNLPHICSFWVKGECKRGEECPYRHEKPTDPDDPLSEQNIKDRYFGVNDPVADKLLTRAKAMPQLFPPEDLAITTLYVGNLGSEDDANVVTEKDLRDYFYQYGEIRNVTLLQQKGCAFVQFTTRRSAEIAAEKAFNKLVVKGRRITVRWGRPQSVARTTEGVDSYGRPMEPVPGLPGPLPTVDFFGLAQAGGFVPEAEEDESEAGPQLEDEEDSEAGPSKKSKPDSAIASLGEGTSGSSWNRRPAGGQQYLIPNMGGQLKPGLRLPPAPNSAPPVAVSHQRGIHYPSQDPLHLGARDIQD